HVARWRAVRRAIASIAPRPTRRFAAPRPIAARRPAARRLATPGSIAARRLAARRLAAPGPIAARGLAAGRLAAPASIAIRRLAVDENRPEGIARRHLGRSYRDLGFGGFGIRGDLGFVGFITRIPNSTLSDH